MRFAASSILALCAATMALAVDLPEVTLSGYLPTGTEEGGAELFYMFYEAQEQVPHIVDDTPVMVWLNGGPGCTSMIGNFYEIGPYRVNEEGKLLKFDYSWNKNYALMFIDQPMGTGLSQGFESPSTAAELIESLYFALNHFFQSNPTYKSRPVFIAGESYAGKYIPALARFILDLAHIDRYSASKKRVHTSIKMYRTQAELLRAELEKDMGLEPGRLLDVDLAALDSVMKPHEEEEAKRKPLGFDVPSFRLFGVAIGSGLTEPREQVQTHADVMYAMGLLDEVQRHKARRMQARVVRYIDAGQFDLAHRAREELLDYLQESAGIPTVLDVRRNIRYRDFLVSDYLNKDEVREKIGAKKGTEVVPCNKSIPWVLTTDIMRGYKHEVEAIVEQIPVLLFQGQFDVKDGYASNLQWIKRMDWADAEGFRHADRNIWTLDGSNKTAGYWKQHGNLAHVVVLNAGHLVPHDAPDASFQMITQWVDSTLDKMYS